MDGARRGLGQAAIAGLFACVLALAGPAHAVPSLKTFACAPVEGLRADSASRAQFLDAFNGTLGETTFMVTAPGRRGDATATSFECRFRLAETVDPLSTWSMRIVVMLPPLATASREELVQEGHNWVRRPVTRSNPHRRRSRRIGVAVSILSPNERANEVEPEPVVSSIAFPAPPAPEGSILVPSTTGYELPWADAGRAAALLALEALHHHSGDLPATASIVVSPGLRADVSP